MWGRGEEGELQQRDLQYVEVFITLADFDVGRLKESEGAAKKKKNDQLYVYVYIRVYKHHCRYIKDLHPDLVKYN